MSRDSDSTITIETGLDGKPRMTREVLVPAGSQDDRGRRMVRGRVRIGDAERAALDRLKADDKRIGGHMGMQSAPQFTEAEGAAIRAERAEADRRFLLENELPHEKSSRERREDLEMSFAAEKRQQGERKAAEHESAEAQRRADLEAARARQARQQEDQLIASHKALTQREATAIPGRL